MSIVDKLVCPETGEQNDVLQPMATELKKQDVKKWDLADRQQRL
jgi:hypothetical protein